MDFKLILFKLLIVFLTFVDLTWGDGECEDKMKGLIEEYNNCVDQSATFEQFCTEANEATVENPDEEKILALIPKYCTGLDQEIRCTRILTNSSNECRFLSQDAVDRSESLAVTMLNFFCENDGKNFLEFSLNEELKKFEEFGNETECESGGMEDTNMFTDDGEFDEAFCSKVDDLYACFADYFAAADNPNLKGLVVELRDKVKEGAQC